MHHECDIDIIRSKSDISSRYWLANGCYQVNGLLVIEMMRFIYPKCQWYIADFGCHCLVTNSKDINSTDFKFNKTEITNDIHYSKLIIDFINYPLDMQLAFCDPRIVNFYKHYYEMENVWR